MASDEWGEPGSVLELGWGAARAGSCWRARAGAARAAASWHRGKAFWVGVTLNPEHLFIGLDRQELIRHGNVEKKIFFIVIYNFYT